MSIIFLFRAWDRVFIQVGRPDTFLDLPDAKTQRRFELLGRRFLWVAQIYLFMRTLCSSIAVVRAVFFHDGKSYVFVVITARMQHLEAKPVRQALAPDLLKRRTRLLFRDVCF